MMPKVSAWQATKKTAKSTHIFDPPRAESTLAEDGGFWFMKG